MLGYTDAGEVSALDRAPEVDDELVLRDACENGRVRGLPLVQLARSFGRIKANHLNEPHGPIVRLWLSSG